MTNWSFDDDLPPEPLVEPGRPRCYHCGTAAPLGIPDPHARCETCKFHLHTCPNCAFYSGIGCLIFSPYMWGESGLMGQDCPYFTWRRPERLSAEELRRVRQRLGLEPDAKGKT